MIAWPIWLAKVQLSLTYGYTAIAKLNPVFLDGIVLTRAFELNDGAQWVAPALSWLVIAIELFTAVALWVRHLRAWAILLGLGLHGLAPIVMGPYAGLVVFSLLVFSVYALFLDPPPHVATTGTAGPPVAAYVP